MILGLVMLRLRSSVAEAISLPGAGGTPSTVIFRPKTNVAALGWPDGTGIHLPGVV